MQRSSDTERLLSVARALTYLLQGFHTFGPALLLYNMQAEHFAGLPITNLGNRSVAIAIGAACFVYCAHIRHFTLRRGG